MLLVKMFALMDFDWVWVLINIEGYANGRSIYIKKLKYKDVEGKCDDTVDIRGKHKNPYAAGG